MNIVLIKFSLATYPGIAIGISVVIILSLFLFTMVKLHSIPFLLKRYSSVVGIYLVAFDNKGNIIFTSKRLNNILGYPINGNSLKSIDQLIDDKEALNLLLIKQPIELNEEVTLNIRSAKGKYFKTNIQKSSISSFRKRYHVLNLSINNTQKEFERYKNLVELLPNMIFEATLDGKITFANQACLKTFGYSYEEIKSGINFKELLDKEEIPRLKEALRTRKLRSGIHGAEFIAETKHKKKITILVYIDYIFTDKKITGLRGVAIDISEQKQKEQEIKNTYNLTLNIIRNAPFGILVINEEGKIRLANQLCTEYFDEKIDSLLYKNIYKTKAFNNSDLRNFVQTLISSNRNISRQIKVLTEDDTTGWVNCFGIPYTGTNQLQNYLIILQDVTQQLEYHDELIRLNMELSTQNIEFLTQKEEMSKLNKLLQKKQKELKAKSDELSLLINNIEIQVWYLINKETYGAVNHAHAKFIGKEDKEIEHQKISQILDLSESEKYQEINKLVYTQKQPIKVEEWFINAQNEPRLLSINLAPKLDLHNEVEYVVCSAIDVTEQTMLSNKLAEAKEEADKANALKSIFLANMSHEIRTPMSAILGYSKILAKEITSGKKLEYIDIIKRNGENLLLLINDILDLSKIEAGKLNIDYKPTSLRAMFNDIKSIFSLKALEKDIELKAEVDANIPRLLLLDETRLRQVLFNLVGNALKFTHKGYVHVKARAVLSDNDITSSNAKIALEIADTGIGIPKNELNSIFEAFQQQKNQHNKYEGTGLGLAISKRLVEMMNGKITIESEVNIGSIFKVFLNDVEILDAIDENLDANHSLFLPTFMGQTVIIAEDNPYNQQLIEALLSERNLKLIKTGNGRETLEALKSNPKTDLILLDIKMPDMDGIEALQHIKNNPATKHIPVIIITAEVMNNNEDNLRKLGCDGFLPKPVDEDKLLYTIAKFLKFQKNPNRFSQNINNINTPVKLLKNIEANPAVFKNILSEIIPIWEKAYTSMQLDIWTKLANALIKQGENLNNPDIMLLGNNLIEVIDSFNIKKLKEFRIAFHSFLNRLTQNNATNVE